MHAAQLGRMAEELQAQSATALVIGGGSPAAAARVHRLLGMSFPVLSDPDRRTYRAYGFEKAWKLIQRSGTVLVDKDGILRYRRGGLNPRSAMSRTELLEELQKLA